MKRKKKQIPFGKRSKRKRREAGIWVSNNIEKDRDFYLGRFISSFPLIDPAGSDPEICNECGTAQFCALDNRMCGNSQSFEFKFLGKHRYDVWDAEIVTARREFWDRVDNMAFDRAWAMLPHEEYQDYDSILSLYDFGSPPVLPPQFGGLSISDYMDKLQREIVEHEPPQLFECFETDYSLHWGFGLKVVLDIDRITLPLIINTIDRFFEMGQKPWRSEMPIARNRLPDQTEGDYVKFLLKKNGE